MIKRFLNLLKRANLNSKGWRTNKRYVVIESDDWGSIRMPNKGVYKSFETLGYDLANNPYCRYDTLENSQDLSALFDVLSKYKDRLGNYPIITANTVVANPDFDQIRASEFEKYFFSPFLSTLNEYYPNDDVFGVWKDGVKNRLFFPQFHGREHLNVPLWLGFLQRSNKALCKAFDYRFWGIPKKYYGNFVNVQASYGSSDPLSIEYYKKIIPEGLNLFKSIFNFSSATFIANNYTWSPELNNVLLKSGILGFQGMKYQKIPNQAGTDLLLNWTGKFNELGQVYIVRNCVFEPSQMPLSFDNIGNCLNEISNAFFFGKPAIISCHRLNFIGSLDESNRDKNLKQFDNLLSNILKKWPNVSFVTSEELINLILNDKES